MNHLKITCYTNPERISDYDGFVLGEYTRFYFCFYCGVRIKTARLDPLTDEVISCS